MAITFRRVLHASMGAGTAAAEERKTAIAKDRESENFMMSKTSLNNSLECVEQEPESLSLEKGWTVRGFLYDSIVAGRFGWMPHSLRY